MSKSKQLSKEEFVSIVRKEIEPLNTGANRLRALIEGVSKSQDANFITIEDAAKFIAEFDQIKSSSKSIKEALIIRLRTRTNEHLLVAKPTKISNPSAILKNITK